MPILEVTTKDSKQVWASPDGQRKIYELTLDFEGKPVTAKTYSDAIATVGWSGTVDTYEKTGRNGIETFVKQPPKEGGFQSSGNSGGQSRSSYVPKDEKAIQAMWAIGQASGLMKIDTKPGEKVEYDVSSIEALAQELFNMVDRVKATPSDLDEVQEVTGDETVEDISVSMDEAVDMAEIDKVFGVTEQVTLDEAIKAKDAK